MVTVEKAVKTYMAYHEANSKLNSIRSFKSTLSKFVDFFSDEDVSAIPDTEIATFLDLICAGCAASTRHGRRGHLLAFFNFTAETFGLSFQNPCSTSFIKKMNRKPRPEQKTLLDREIIDEIIYSAKGADRLMLELMGRGGMRIGEVLDIKPRNFNFEVNTVALENPKSGRRGEVVYLPAKLMRRLSDHVRDIKAGDDDRIFPISYTTARRRVVRYAGGVGVKLKPHDLRHHAATQASRSGIPLEIVSKVILRHANLATTQIYLGAVSPAEASRAVESLYG